MSLFGMLGRRIGTGLVVLAIAGHPASAQQARGKDPTAPKEPPVTVVEASGFREAALNKIEELAKSNEAQIRANCVEAAGQSPKRLGAIIDSGISDPNLGVRTVACVVVGKLKLATYSDRVSALLSDNSEYVRAAALFALKRCGQNPDITPLSSYLLDNPNAKIRAHVALLLGELGDKSAVPMLRQAAASNVPRASDIEVRLMHLQAAEALVKLGDEAAMESIRAALLTSRPEEYEASVLAAQILGTLKDKSSTKLLGNIVDFVDPRDGKSKQPAELRLAAVATLAQLGYPDGDYVAEEYMTDPNPAIRAQAAYAFGEIATPLAIRKLNTMLADPVPQVQLSAAAGILKAVGK